MNNFLKYKRYEQSKGTNSTKQSSINSHKKQNKKPNTRRTSVFFFSNNKNPIYTYNSKPVMLLQYFYTA